MPEEPTSTRDARPPAGPPTRVSPGERWAILVGISTYLDPRLNLRFAARDARELAAVLHSPTGGGFAADHVRLLVDDEATSREVTRSLRGFLTRPAPEDLVLLYFACHGGPDPRRPLGPLYLLTHDTEPDDIAGTAVEMAVIDRALRDVLLAERVVVLADTCHSAALAAPGRRSVNSAEATNVYLARLGETKPGVALLTSCEAAESSQEGERWGQGHGVFTWHVLEGMRGAADGFGRARDGIVGVGELFDYVRERVQADTAGEQHPNIGATSFDRNLPLAVTSDMDVRRHLDLGRALLGLGWLTDDPAAHALAAGEADEATMLAALTGRRSPEAATVRAEALLALGRATEAAATLDGVPAVDLAGDANLLHGVALAESGRADEAAAALRWFATKYPDHDEATWATDYAAGLAKGPGGTRRALLIGAGTYRYPNINLPGASNDPGLLAQVLTERAGFGPSDLRLLVDAAATRAQVLQGLDELANRSGPDDTVVVSYSGHSPSGRSPDDVYLLTHDAQRDVLAGVTSHELAERLGRVEARAALLVLDTSVSPAFRELMTAHLDWVVIAPSGQAWDALIDGTPNGAFTRSLAEVWPHQGEVATTYGSLVERMAGWLGEHGYDTSAVLVQGNSNAHLLGGGFLAGDLWRLGRLGTFARYDARTWAQRFAPMAEYPTAAWAAGRSQTEGRSAQDALIWLRRAQAQLSGYRVALQLDCVDAQLAAGRVTEAAAAAAECSPWPEAAGDEFAAAAVAATTQAIGALRRARARGLVVGIERYADSTLTPPVGTRSDAESFAATLVAAAGLGRDDIVVLLDEDATRDRILAEFDVLAEHGAQELAVFHFAGLGSWTPDGRQSLVAYDGRTPAGPTGIPDLAIAELATRAVHANNLVCVIDAGGVPGSVPSTAAAAVTGTRTAPPAEGRLGGSVGLAGRLEHPTVGVATLTPAVPARSKDKRLEVPVTGSDRVRGRLTQGLERALHRTRELDQPTY